MSDRFPEELQFIGILPGRVDQRATTLLHPVDEKGEHHQLGQDVRQAAIAMAKTVTELAAMRFRYVERLVFHTSSSTPGAHETYHRLPVHQHVGDPGEMLPPALWTGLPTLADVDLQIRMGLVDRHPVPVAELVPYTPVLRLHVRRLLSGSSNTAA